MGYILTNDNPRPSHVSHLVHLQACSCFTRLSDWIEPEHRNQDEEVVVSVLGCYSYDVETVEVSTDIFVRCMKLYIPMTDPDVFARQDTTNH